MIRLSRIFCWAAPNRRHARNRNPARKTRQIHERALDLAFGPGERTRRRWRLADDFLRQVKRVFRRGAEISTRGACAPRKHVSLLADPVADERYARKRMRILGCGSAAL